MVVAGDCWTEAVWRERGTVSLAPQEGEERCSVGFGSSLTPAGAGLWSGPCTALPPMGTATTGATATSLLLGILLLILSGRDDCNRAILAQAFLINFPQAARCFWPGCPWVRGFPLPTFPAFGVGKEHEPHSTGWVSGWWGGAAAQFTGAPPIKGLGE